MVNEYAEFFFDTGFKISFDLPVIAVGNLSVGGTGKTPHEYYLFVYYQIIIKLTEVIKTI
jgi:tetraacyldisaccharide 4'-kinase